MSGTDIYDSGSWSCTYFVSPVDDPPTLPRFRDILLEVKGTETGWPVWLALMGRPEMHPRIVGDVIECWLDKTPDADFWRADPRGRMFLIRRLQEDTREIPGVEPGQIVDLTLPVWRTGECLLHAARLANRLGATDVNLAMTWTGLEGRELTTRASPNRMVMPGRICRDNTVRTDISAEAKAIPDALPELVKRLVAPLFARFDFLEPPEELYETELARMRRGV